MVSHEKFTKENPGEEYGYDQADNYREESGPMNAPPFRGNPTGSYQSTGYRPRMSNPQGGYQTGPSGYSSRRYHIDDHVYPSEYGNARGYGGVRHDYPNYYHQNHYHDGYHDYRHHDYQDNRDHGYHHNDHHHHDYGPSRLRDMFNPGYLNSVMRNPMTNNFFRGVGVATIAILLAPPIARALKPLAVQVVHGVTNIVDELKGVMSDAREDIEDIFADGKWSNMEHDGTVKQPPSDNQ